MKRYHEDIRDLLFEGPMTISEIARALPGKPSPGTVNGSLRGMPDVYIESWRPVPSSPRGYAAVWAVVETPLNAPLPPDYVGRIRA